MTKEIRSPNVEERSGVQMPVCHSGFGIPLAALSSRRSGSDFVIRHSDLRFGSWRAPFRFSACIGTMNLERVVGAADKVLPTSRRQSFPPNPLPARCRQHSPVHWKNGLRWDVDRHDKIFSFQMANESYWRHDEAVRQWARAMAGSSMSLRIGIVGCRRAVSGGRAFSKSRGAGALGRLRGDQFPILLLRVGRAKARP